MEIGKFGNSCELCKKNVDPTVQRKLATCFKSLFVRQQTKCKLISKYFDKFQKALKLLKEVINSGDCLEDKENVIRKALQVYWMTRGGENEEENDGEKFTWEKDSLCKKYLKEQFPCCMECYLPIMKFRKMIDEFQLKAFIDLKEALERNQIESEKEAENVSFLPDLPVEMWEEILYKMTCLSDLRNCVNSFVGWRKALQRQMIYWLFPTMIFPKLFEYLNIKDVLNCRVACSQWCQGVDEFLEGHNHLAPYVDNQSYWEITRKLRLTNKLPESESSSASAEISGRNSGYLLVPYQIGNSQQSLIYWNGAHMSQARINLFLGQRRPGFIENVQNLDSRVPRTNNRSPLIGRALQITKVACFTNTFSIFGSHLWDLDLSYGDQQISCLDLIGYLCTIIKMCKNLRQLRLSARNIHACDTFMALKNHGGVSFPIFSSQVEGPSLKTLQLETNAARCYGIDDLLIKKFAGGLGRLEVEGWDTRTSVWNWTLQNWSNLTELHIFSKDEIFCKFNNGVIPFITPLASSAPNLRKLGLAYYCDPENPNMKYPLELREFLQKLKKLQWLKLFFNDQKLQRMKAEGKVEDSQKIFRMFWINFTNQGGTVSVSLPQIKIFETNHRPINKSVFKTFLNLEEVIFDEVECLNLPDIEMAVNLDLLEDFKDIIREDPIILEKYCIVQMKGFHCSHHSLMNKVVRRNNEEIEREIYDSDVWELCQNLKSLILNGKLFSRKLYKIWKEEKVTVIKMDEFRKCDCSPIKFDW